MRVRTTWNMNEILTRTAAAGPTAAMNRTADPYAMNQDHKQPDADKYLTGDPSAFAEDITTPDNWKVEYSGGAMKRDEIGLAEVRPDTFNHPEKTAAMNQQAILKKADLTVRIARRMFGANAPDALIEEQAGSLMHLPDQDVIATYTRLAGEMPPQFKDNAEKKKEEAAQAQGEAQEQAKQAALRGDKVALDAAIAKLVKLANEEHFPGGQFPTQAGQQQQAQGQQAPAQQQAGQQQQAQGQQGQQAPAQQQAGQQQQSAQDQQSAWYDSKGQRPGHSGPDTGPYAGQQQMPPAQQQAQQQMPPPAQQQAQQQVPPPAFQQQQAQGQPQQGVESQVQQMIEQAAQQMQAPKMANDPQQAPAQQQAGQQQQAQGQQAPAQQQAGQQQQAQGQGQQAPAQQQAGQQQQATGYQQGCGPMMQQAQGLTNPSQGISPNYAQQPQMMQASDDQLLDQMLAPGAGQGGGVVPSAPIAEMDIQMDAPNMDIGDVNFAPGEDDVLRQLFSSGDEALAAQQAQEAQGQGQQVQGRVRTASSALRTIGTVPTGGVARIGGASSGPSRGQEVDRLTNLWQSAPDVREAFGLK
jgi:hypothetical protein